MNSFKSFISYTAILLAFLIVGVVLLFLTVHLSVGVSALPGECAGCGKRLKASEVRVVIGTDRKSILCNDCLKRWVNEGVMK